MLCGSRASAASRRPLLQQEVLGKKKRDPDLRAARLQDEGAFSKLVDNVRSNFNDNADLGRRWGGGIMGEKSQERTRQKERAVAREAAKRMQV